MRRKRSTDQVQERAGAYVRVSVDRAAQGKQEEIISPETQLDRARAYAASQGWVMTAIEQDIDESAYRQHYSKRPGLMRLLEAVERGEITKIIVWKWSRLSRRLVEFLELCNRIEAAGAGVVSVSEQVDTATPAGRLIRNIMASFAQYQSEELSEQIWESWMTRAKEGRRPPGIAPFGAVNEKGILRPDPATHHHLLAMYRVFVETRSTRAAWDYLTEHQVPPPRADAAGWSLNTVKHILGNPVYVGRLDWDGETFEGRWEPLVPPYLWEAAQGILAGRKTGPVQRRDAHMLTGTAVCGGCGRPLWTQYVQRLNAGRRVLMRAYACIDPLNRRRGCDIPGLHAEEAEAAVWQAVVQLLSSADVDRLIAARDFGQVDPGLLAQQRALIVRREQLQQDTSMLFDLLRTGDMTREQFREQNARLVEELRQVERELEGQARPAAGPQPAQMRAAAARVPLAATPEERRQLLADLGARVEVTVGGVYLNLLGLRLNLRARSMGDTWHLGPEYQRLDYHGWTLTDRQIRYLQRTWAWADRKKLADRLGRTYKGLWNAASRLRQKGILGSTTPVN